MLKLSGYLCLSAFALAAGAVLAQDLPVAARQQAMVDSSQPNPATAATSIASNQLTPVQLGNVLVLEHRYQAAITAYARSPQMTADLWNKMGIANELMLNFTEAARCYNLSLKLNPSDPRVINNLGTLHETLREYDAANRLYRKAIKLDPNYALSYKNLGTSLIAQHDYKKGWDAYKHALALDPSSFNNNEYLTMGNASKVHDRGAINYYMAVACVRSGQVDRALDHLRAALDEGFVSPGDIATDGAFARLNDNPAFRKMLAEQTP